jgi:hypothetical protein
MLKALFPGAVLDTVPVAFGRPSYSEYFREIMGQFTQAFPFSLKAFQTYVAHREEAESAE